MPDTDNSNGLSSVEKITEAAAALAGIADSAQGWVKQQSDAKKIPQEEAHELLSSIEEVRLIAGNLHVAAGQAIVHSLGASQAAILAVIAGATAAIAKIRDVEQMIDLAANLFELASAIGGGKGGQVLASLQDIEGNVKTITGS
jgi:hypothetical protein